MRDVAEALDAVDLAVRRGEGFVDEAQLSSLLRRMRSLRDRRGYAEDTLVVAIAGGTGSGKSSLLNALAGEPIASVSALRPHTDKPLAWIPSQAGYGLYRLLDDLNIPDRVTQDLFPNVALVDLPDMDSIASWHRTMVEQLLPNVDAVIWVLDPEKYRDRTLHEDFLAPLSRHRSQFLFVINKMDLIRDEDDRSVVMSHVLGVLSDDGYVDPALYGVAAAPVTGPPFGVERLAHHLRERMDAKRVSVAKLLMDAFQVVEAMGVAGGVWNGCAIDFDARWEKVRDAAAAGLVADAGAAAREDALCRVEDFIAAVSVETGGLFGERMRSEFPGSRIDAEMNAVVEAAKTAPNQASRGIRRQPEPAARIMAARALDERLGLPLRDLLLERAAFGGTIAYAGVGVAQVADRVM
jgi:GTP-binding protein EngB required for normal cell division